MSSKITKQMISRVDEMVSTASSATKQATEGNKRKAARRAIVAALSKSHGKKSSSKIVRKKKGDIANRARPRSLLEEARRELKGQSKLAWNVSLLTFSKHTGKKEKSVGTKAKKAVEELLKRDKAGR